MASVDRVSLADRFEGAWRALESHLRQQWRQYSGYSSAKAPDAAGLTAWARGQSILTSDQETFLDRCRGVRNAYAHVAFDDYSGPVAFPPRQVVERLEKILGGLRDPKAIEDVARTAEVRGWTWAGFRANATLVATLSELADPSQRYDDASIRLRPDLDREMWRIATADAANRICLPDVTEKALAGLKFSAALPSRLAAATLAARLADIESATAVLQEPVRFAYL